MVIFDIIALSGLPLTLATVEGARHQKSTERRVDEDEQLRLKDFNIEVYCDANSRKSKEVNGTIVTLRNGKVIAFLSLAKEY
jgi:hypothetical protein